MSKTLERAAGWLRDQHEAPSLLVGHSLGGAAVLAAASRIPEVTAVATIGAPFDPAHLAGCAWPPACRAPVNGPPLSVSKAANERNHT